MLVLTVTRRWSPFPVKSFSHSSGFLAATAILVNYCGCQDLSSLAVQSGHRDTASATAVTDHSCQGPYSGTTGPEQVPEGGKMASERRH